MSWTTPRTYTTGETLTAAIFNTDHRDNLNFILPDGSGIASWSAALEGTTSGSSAAQSSGQYQVGGLMHVWARFRNSANDFPLGTFFVALPTAATGLGSSLEAGSGQVIGSWQCRDDSTASQNEGGAVLLRAAGEVHFSRPTGGMVTDSSPVTWATDDILSFHAVYTVA